MQNRVLRYCGRDLSTALVSLASLKMTAGEVGTAENNEMVRDSTPKPLPLIDIRRFSLLPLGKTNKFVLPSLNRNVVKGRGWGGNVRVKM